MKPSSHPVKSLPRRLWIAAEALRGGYLKEGLQALTKVYEERNWLDRILMAGVLLNLKGPSHAEGILKRAIDETEMPWSLRAMAHSRLGTALVYRNRFSDAVRSFERSVYFAQKANDQYQVCEAQLGLLAAKVDCYGPTAVGTLMAEAFRSVQAAGDPYLLALLHYRAAVVEGRRGATDVAQRHVDLALGLLEKTPNPWLESCVRLTASSVSFVSADLHGALDHAERALHSSRISGAFYYELASLTNACQVCVALGRFDEAARYIEAARPSLSESPFIRFCLYDIKAQLQLATDDLDGCEDTLAALSNQIARTTEDEESFPQLDSLVTKIRLLQQQGRLDEAHTAAAQAAMTACTRGERLLEVTFQILQAGLLLDLGRVDEASRVAYSAIAATNRTSVESLTTRAELEHVRGRILRRMGAKTGAMQALERAERIQAAVGDAIAREATIASMAQMSSPLQVTQPSSAEGSDQSSTDALRLNLVDSLASLCALGKHPDLLGAEAFEILLSSGATERVALISTAEATHRVAREHNWPDAIDHVQAVDVVALPLGTTKGTTFTLLVEPRAHFLARSALTNVTTLIQVVLAKEEHRREKLRYGSVWPLDYYAEGPGGLFSGQRMGDVLAQAAKVAKSPLTILLTGETGVGKEVLAREIHRLSLRAEQVFQPIVCAGMASGLLESQLFGHKKGSFTGAVSDFPGLIQGTKGGTLFLDEIGELTTDLQIKLLRFLESKEIHPLGELRPFQVDVRVIAATNANLHQMVEEGKFREDLYYRLNVATFNIPPLRERREDIPSLVQHFLADYSRQNDKPLPKVSDEALEYLLLYRWPGNVRELRNEMQRLAGMVDAGATIEPSDLKPQILSTRKTSPASSGPHEIGIRTDQPLHEAVDQLEKEMIRRVLNGYQGNLDSAARALGLTRKGLYHKRQRFGLL